jgi:2-dehydro-3-deoxyphosphogluconate aldolase/(4S)-4-hydroxy-2-oxoglutarate aldolase
MQSKHNPLLADSLRRVPVVPVLTVEDPATAPDLALALIRGGLDVLEITLRTPAALEGIRRIIEAAPQALVGAGTVLTPEQGQAAAAAGARFAVSPGMTPRLVAAANEWPIPFLPGAATASEAMALADLGYRVLKFFPAEPAGGQAALKALAAPLPHVLFCPTGGIDAPKAAHYLKLPNVVTVGGSWVAPAEAIAHRRWDEITRLAREAMQLRP